MFLERTIALVLGTELERSTQPDRLPLADAGLLPPKRLAIEQARLYQGYFLSGSLNTNAPIQADFAFQTIMD